MFDEIRGPATARTDGEIEPPAEARGEASEARRGTQGEPKDGPRRGEARRAERKDRRQETRPSPSQGKPRTTAKDDDADEPDDRSPSPTTAARPEQDRPEARPTQSKPRTTPTTSVQIEDIRRRRRCKIESGERPATSAPSAESRSTAPPPTPPTAAAPEQRDGSPHQRPPEARRRPVTRADGPKGR